MREIKKVAVIGMGAIGGFVARELYGLLGDDFYLLAGGARKERLEKNGVTINGVNYKFNVVAPEDTSGYADFVIFTVKNTQLEQAIADMKNQIGPDTIVMSLLNGVTSEIHIKNAYYPDNVLTSVIRVPALHSESGISFPENWGKISFGEEKNDPENYTEKVLAVKDLFDRAGVNYVICEDMLKDMWMKYISNVSENQTCAILQVPYKGFNASREHVDVVRKMAAREVIAICEKKGINITQEDFDARDAYIYSLNPAGKPSTYQDIETGRKTEVETFAGDMIRMGKEYGVPTPINELFYHMIKALEEKNEGMFEV